MRFPHEAGKLLLDLAQGPGPNITQADIFELSFRSVLEYTPRAKGAHNERERFRASDGIPGYHAEEKLDGMYVLWTGHRLVSKRGKPILNAGFTNLLPPFPLVGELYSGNGRYHRADHVVSREEGDATQRLSETWTMLRLVAFDVPGMDDWEYQQRYALLCHVVAAWSKWCMDRGRVTKLTDLPLYVMIRYPISKLPDLFRAVCEGHTWQERADAGLLPFGVPRTQSVTTPVWTFGECSIRLGNGQSLHLAARRGAADQLEWLPMPDPFMAREHGRHSGEGCMLWQDAGRWEARGTAGKFTSTVVKYKPIMLLAAMAISAPYHSHLNVPAEDRAQQEDRLPGYHIQLLWHSTDDVRHIFKSWIPPQRRDVTLQFPLYKRCFVQTVVYPPRMGRVIALGRQLTNPEGLAVLEHAYHQWEHRRQIANRSGYVGEKPPPTLYRLSNAEHWHMGELRALFPCD